MKLPPTDTQLAWLLRLIGAALLLALPATFLAYPAMNAVHRNALCLGELPRAVIVEYLTRTISLLYAMHGALMIFVSFDVRRYRPLIVTMGWLNGLFGAAACGIDLAVGMPWWWAAWEGPVIVGAAILTVRLAKSRPDDFADLTQVP